MSDRCKPLTYFQRKELRRALTPFPFHRTLGCITCKAKRLKCDESKPTCLQCKKRNVECGGYKKDFKWRPFEETNVVSRISSIQARKSKCAGLQGLHFLATTKISQVIRPHQAKKGGPVIQCRRARIVNLGRLALDHPHRQHPLWNRMMLHPFIHSSQAIRLPLTHHLH
jgi:hypothetical protein